MTKYILAAALAATIFACGDSGKKSTESTSSEPAMMAAPAFSGDSAYKSIEQQLAFGPRVPNTPAHERGGDYIVAKLKSYGVEIIEQPFTVKGWDGITVKGRNIIGVINPRATKRIFFSSHWDSRRFSDHDSIPANVKKPVPAANDGASGVAVLLEMARTIQQAKTKPAVGVDLIFFDAEDWGDGDKAVGDTEAASGQFDYIGFCLGSRHWAKNPHKPGYTAYYGVLLDMVGAKGATFLREGYSMQYAPSVVQTLWSTASRLGYGQYFPELNGGPITDDHMAPNLIAKIPTVDIIHLSTVTGSFFPDWHTAEDDMRNIDKNTLKAVGQTLLQAIYNEQVQ
ncbi:M28 family peptidase [Fibrella sp. HMF5335]|uniref:M28 family peptidase n=1 Tax=Fibrella rubiginis TaxID=2817060 RepID=A0A939GHT2_9BACT|nr:M28 family peptidase [Fibrella rubiginis]MBO0936723.1 M28 family peptidase [Fibrella rubiginis]